MTNKRLTVTTVACSISIACSWTKVGGNGDVGIQKPAPESAVAVAMRDAPSSQDAATVGAAQAGASAQSLPSAAPIPADLCIENPSFEGTPALDSVPSGWTTCSGTPDLGPVAGSIMAASAGASYLQLQAGQNTESVSAPVCAAARARPLRFQIDLGMLSPPLTLVVGVIPPQELQLQLWGGREPCALDELLWASPVITRLNAWQSVCGTLEPQPELRFVTWRPVDISAPTLTIPSVSMLLTLDNLRDCP
jgi:hypothetical protein